MCKDAAPCAFWVCSGAALPGPWFSMHRGQAVSYRGDHLQVSLARSRPASAQTWTAMCAAAQQELAGLLHPELFRFAQALCHAGPSTEVTRCTVVVTMYRQHVS